MGAAARPDKHKNEAASHSKRPAVGAAIAALLGGWLLPQPKWPFGASADGFDWAHASSRPCTMTQPIKLSEAERLSGLLSPTHLREALATFAACGVVAIDEAIPARDVAAFRSALAARLEPHLESRARVRTALKHAMTHRGSLRALWDEGETSPGLRVQDELLFADGAEVRERNSGRLDVELPWRGPPYGAAAFVHNPHARPLLRALLGEQHRLHSAHAVVSLGGDEAEAQHWHRDNALLFDGRAPPPPSAPFQMQPTRFASARRSLSRAREPRLPRPVLLSRRGGRGAAPVRDQRLRPANPAGGAQRADRVRPRHAPARARRRGLRRNPTAVVTLILILTHPHPHPHPHPQPHLTSPRSSRRRVTTASPWAPAA